MNYEEMALIKTNPEEQHFKTLIKAEHVTPN
jgi:hypothetical protein